MDNIIDKIKHKALYKINETARFKEIEETSFDIIPSELLEDDDNTNFEPEEDTPPTPPDVEDTPMDQAELPNDLPMDNTTDISMPVGDNPIEDTPQEKTVDEIQNEVIKLNTVALDDLNKKLKEIIDVTDQITNKINKLSVNVEEVREPSAEEKLMNQKNVSYPYYSNLNDYWNGSWFEEKKEEYGVGIKPVGDGSFVADFDELPKTNTLELKDSFNDLI